MNRDDSSLSLTHHAISNYAPYIGARYSFSRQRNRFTSVIATVSMLGMVLGVASLIVVLSIMNGFSGELRARILSLMRRQLSLVEARIAFCAHARIATAYLSVCACGCVCVHRE